MSAGLEQLFQSGLSAEPLHSSLGPKNQSEGPTKSVHAARATRSLWSQLLLKKSKPAGSTFDYAEAHFCMDADEDTRCSTAWNGGGLWEKNRNSDFRSDAGNSEAKLALGSFRQTKHLSSLCVCVVCTSLDRSHVNIAEVQVS